MPRGPKGYHSEENPKLNLETTGITFACNHGRHDVCESRTCKCSCHKKAAKPSQSEFLPAISTKITVHGRVKSIAADTPDELIGKLSRVLAKEGIDVWAILSKKRRRR